MIVSDLPSWRDFFSVTAEVAATLSGLVFVATSINLTRIVSGPGLTSLAAESLIQLLGGMAISILALLPGETNIFFGLSVLGLTVVLYSLQAWFQIDFVRRSAARRWRYVANRTGRTHLSCVPLLVAGVLLAYRGSSGMVWLVPGLLLSYVAGVGNAWVLLVKVVTLNEESTEALPKAETAHGRNIRRG